VADRVDDLVGRLTIDEKIGLLHQYQAPVPRLGLGRFVNGTEVLHGVTDQGPATVFPQAVGLGSTWNPELLAAVGAAVGDEVRAFHHKDPGRCGLNVWGPVVNLLRDPRWGRNEEGYSEDPLLTAVMGEAYVRGLRGDHPRYLRTAPTLKHFLAYNNETRRCETSSNLPPRVLREYELPAFLGPLRSAVAVMASYNLVNGRPAHLSPLINDVLGDVLVVSDAFAPSNVVTLQHYHPDHATSHAAMLRAGMVSFTDNGPDSAPTIGRLTEALDRGLLDESDVDTAVRRILTMRFRLGEFDEHDPYSAVTDELVNCAAHQALALEAARQSIVLLKNDGILPLAAGERVAVIGPLGDTLHEDWYSGTLPYAVTIRQGIAERVGSATFTEGVDRLAFRGRHFDVFDWGRGVCALRSVDSGRFLTVDDTVAVVDTAEQPNGWIVRETFTLEAFGDGVVIRHIATGAYLTIDAGGRWRADAAPPPEATLFAVERIANGVEQAAAAARDADVAIVVLGNHPLINGRETEDRVDLALPPAQEDLLRAVHAANPRTVVVLTSSYPYAIADAELPAVLWSAHGGQELGHAVTEVLFGDTGPAGRLTQTWYRDARDLPDLLDYDIIAGDATYLYFRGTPLYPFGHGLTYAPFEYTDLRLSADRMSQGETVTATVEVHNPSDRDSDEVVQLYTRQTRSRVKQPVRQLRGFRRIHVPAHERRTVHFELRADDLAFWDVVGDRYVVETARHDVMAGRSSADIRLTTSIHVDGEQVASWHTGQPFPAINADAYAYVDLVDATRTTGDAVLATAYGAWVAFQQVSFDPTVTRCTARLSSVLPGNASVILRAGDPFDGPLIATLIVETAGDRYVWREATAPVEPVDGPVNLYAVLGSPGVCLRDLTFTR
jgi:beta-glucosidase